MQKEFTYILNPELPVHKVLSYNGVPTRGGKYYNIEPTILPTYKDMLRWQTTRREALALKKKDSFSMPVVTADHWIENKRDGILWLGHASYLLQWNGIRILIDPVLENLGPFVARLSALPIDKALLKKIDYILVSHDHRDHCDEASLRYLQHLNNRVEFLTGLGLKSLIAQWTKSDKIQEAAWHQSYRLSNPEIKITYLPARHWCRRGLFDINMRLWGGFLIELSNLVIYFVGDSGMGEHFQIIADHYPTPDFMMVGVGAYKPEWFMARSHTSPNDALEAAKILRARKILPMHYGSFDLADDRLGEPREVLQGLLQKEPMLAEKLQILDIGETVNF